ncbi:hypothetical protein ABIF74_011782 [Bradyrhizobium japonicum]
MTDFDVVKLHCLALEILNEIADLPANSAPEIATVSFDEASLKDFRPLHELSAGWRKAAFQRKRYERPTEPRTWCGRPTHRA